MALIPPVGMGSISASMPMPSVTAPSSTTGATGASGSGASFGDAIGNALDSLQASQTKADDLARDAATGKLKNVEEYLLAATDAQLGTQLTVAVRNRAVESFNEIMRMQV